MERNLDLNEGLLYCCNGGDYMWGLDQSGVLDYRDRKERG